MLKYYEVNQSIIDIGWDGMDHEWMEIVSLDRHDIWKNWKSEWNGSLIIRQLWKVTGSFYSIVRPLITHPDITQFYYQNTTIRKKY